MTTYPPGGRAWALVPAPPGSDQSLARVTEPSHEDTKDLERRPEKGFGARPRGASSPGQLIRRFGSLILNLTPARRRSHHPPRSRTPRSVRPRSALA
jgi:hypothetical protein